MDYQLLKLGSDAEFFLMRKDQLVPVCGLIGGTKDNPRPVLTGQGFAVQEDNVTLEFNIPPAANASEFADNITKMLVYLRQELQNMDLVPRYNSAEFFPMAVLQEHLKAFAFGCEPDFCVWTRSVNVTPDPITQFPSPRKPTPAIAGQFRAAGYHVHASYLVAKRDSTLEEKELFVKAQDLFLGVPATLLESNRKPSARRAFYGRAGAFRPKAYGHEYRVLGSNVLSDNPARHKWIYENTQAAIAWLNTCETPDIADQHFGRISQFIWSAINDSHHDSAQMLMTTYNIAPIPQ